MKIYCNYYRQKGHWQRKHEKKKKDEKSSNETNVMERSIFITNTNQFFKDSPTYDEINEVRLIRKMFN
jgi:hypothetical protein